MSLAQAIGGSVARTPSSAIVRRTPRSPNLSGRGTRWTAADEASAPRRRLALDKPLAARDIPAA